MTNFKGYEEVLFEAVENKDDDYIFGNMNRMEDINKKFYKPDDTKIKNWTILLHAATYGNVMMMDGLVDFGNADINATDSNGNTALYWARQNKNPEDSSQIENLLLEKGLTSETGEIGEIHDPDQDAEDEAIDAFLDGGLDGLLGKMDIDPDKI